MRCVVLNCNNAKNDEYPDMYFFKFPKNADLAKRWLSFCGNKNALGMKNAGICIDHFKDEDIVGLEKCKSGFARHVSLGLNAVPCILVKPKSTSETVEETVYNVQETVYDVGETVEETEYNVELTEFEEIQSESNEDFPEANDEAEENQESLTQFNKCRTCYRDYTFDLDDEDPFAEHNSMLLYRIEVICGVWLSNIEGGPRYMCPDCQSTLKNAIEFRERVISTEVMLTQGKPVCSKPEVDIKLVSTKKSKRKSAPDWTLDSTKTDQRTSAAGWTSELVSFNTEDDDQEYTQYEHLYDAPSIPINSPNSNKIDHMEIEIIEENISPTRADSVSAARGTKILSKMINEFTGQEKDKPERTKNETKAEKPTKERAKPRKMKIQARRQDDDEDDSEFIIFHAYDKKMKLSPINTSKRTTFKRSVRSSRVEND